MIDPSVLIELTLSMLKLVLLASLPAVVVAAVVGLVIGVLQAVTQLQDQSVPFAVKLLAVFATVALTAGWVGGLFAQFVRQTLAAVARVV